MELLPKSSVSKKIVMALTGQAMFLFLVAHLIGNLTIYSGQLNAYAERLDSLPLLIWFSRVVLILSFSAHFITGIRLYIDDRKSKPGSYAVKKSLSATFAGKTMIWSGLFTAGFLVYHLLHFTLQLIMPESSAGLNIDSMGRADVSGMVVSGFQNSLIPFIYVFSMIFLMMHLTHGIQSSFQTLGLNSESSMPLITRIGVIAALITFLGFASIPATIFYGSN